MVERDSLERFAVADPLYGTELKKQYERIRFEYGQMIGRRGAGDRPVAEFGGHAPGLDAVAGCRSVGVLDTIVRPLIQSHGATQYQHVVLQLSRQNARPVQYRYLCGVQPEWIHLYLNQRRWFTVDRSISQAISDTAAFAGSSVGARGADQREMQQAAREHGWVSWWAYPVHYRVREWLGILYVANAMPVSDGGEAELARFALPLKQLSTELLEWRLQELRRGFSERHSLSGKEMRVLQYAMDGLSSGDVADRLGLSVRTVYDINTAICEKIGINGIKDAAKYAWEEGIPA
ncbi:helix-turn-helix transcriptional regulator [Burkholderia cenocepacia]|uniref:helix-turn-helix transcriptional regulator n=1 Tax=Burkholderia cenocepacia TaxID=95486 RepID=UPI002AB7B073|nr:helix-turn-helix transcriptional regulator [Burkholderia cenocepacia]